MKQRVKMSNLAATQQTNRLHYFGAIHKLKVCPVSSYRWIVFTRPRHPDLATQPSVHEMALGQLKLSIHHRNMEDTRSLPRGSNVEKKRRKVSSSSILPFFFPLQKPREISLKRVEEPGYASVVAWKQNSDKLIVLGGR